MRLFLNPKNEMNKQWVLREKISDDLEEHLLFYRGIKTKEKAENFFHLDYNRDLADPFLFSSMAQITERVLRAIEAKEKIIVFGDYDADGICASAIFYDFFKKIGFENFEVYIPSRVQEGYGLNFAVIENFIREKVSLIITVDCGITDYEEVKKAREEGIDVIIIDHHLSLEKSPAAFAILDPQIGDEKYPFRQFCGAGLAFKVISALVKQPPFKIIPGWEKWLLDLAAIATVADMFPLIDENRVLVFYGLEVLKKTRRLGLLALMKKLQIEKLNITEDDIGFLIAPCINAASRMDHGATSYALLTTDSLEEAEFLSQKLIEENNERKRTVEEIFKKINTELEKADLSEILVLGDENWPLGILPPLVNRLLEKYNRPVAVWGQGVPDGEIKGSCRSNGRINLVDLLNEIGEKVFVEFGGHAFSSGFTVKKDKLSDLKKEIEKAYKKIPHQEVEQEIFWLDAALNLEEVNWALIALLEKFRPFGMGNPKPVFLFSEIEVWDVRNLGNSGLHLRLDFKKPSGEIIPAIGFFMNQRLSFPVEKGAKIDLAANVEKSTYNGYLELRLRIVDIRKAE